jgi:tryptophanyl-tRNA synthetase
VTTSSNPSAGHENPPIEKKRVLSGMRPTGKLHLGNYMGALHNWVGMQDKYECYFFIADYHALTTDYADPSQVRQNTLEVATDFLAAGLDPAKSVLFIQSHVVHHAELHLLLSMITSLGWLERVPSYKEQQENITGKDLTTYGFLGYPLLQSADILLYQPQFVPVGQDQAAHVELTREIARRFNSYYARQQAVRGSYAAVGALAAGLPRVPTEPIPGEEILPEPQTLLTPSPKLLGTDGRKMSKSYGNTILLSEPEADLRQKLKSMVTDPARVRRTDPGSPDKCPVGDLHKIFSSAETLAKVYDGCTTAGIGCIECKGWAADSIVTALKPIQERRKPYEENPELVWEILEDGGAKARKRAEQTMVEVRHAMGLAPRRRGSMGA